MFEQQEDENSNGLYKGLYSTCMWEMNFNHRVTPVLETVEHKSMFKLEYWFYSWRGRKAKVSLDMNEGAQYEFKAFRQT